MNKCLILFLLLLCVFLLCSPSTKAYTPQDILDNLTILQDKGLITGLPTDYNSNSAWSSLKDFYYSFGIQNYFIGITSSTSSILANKIIIYYTANNATSFINSSNDPGNSFYHYWKVNTGRYNGCSFNMNGSNNSSGTFALNQVSWTYFYTTININTRSWQQEADTEYGGHYLTSSLVFEPFPEPTKTLNGVTYYIKSISRSVNEWRLGTLTGISPNEQGYGRATGFFEKYVGYWVPLTPIFINSEFGSSSEIYIENSKVLYNNAYRVMFQDSENRTDYTYFYFIPYGQSFSGDLVSGDLVYTGNDNNDNFDVISSINEQYEVNSGEIALILDDYLPSGNFFSGDFGVFTEAFKHDYTNSAFDKLYAFYRNILYTLTLQGDVTLDVGYRNWSTTLHSSDYVVPDNPIKTLVSTLLILWTIFLIYQQIDLMIRHITTFNVFGFLHDSDVDYHMFL